MKRESFSGRVKGELCRIEACGIEGERAELCALLWLLVKIEGSGAGTGQVFQLFAENDSVSEKCFTLLKKNINMNLAQFVQEHSTGQRSKHSAIRFPWEASLKNMAKELGLQEDYFQEDYFQEDYFQEDYLQKDYLQKDYLQKDHVQKDHIPKESGVLVLKAPPVLIWGEESLKAFIRGAFLAAGSVNDPSKNYHLEFVCPDRTKACQLIEALGFFHVEAKTVQRKNSHVVYVKEGAAIAGLLALMGAKDALLSMEDIRSLKETRNSVNRQVNCETANINKTVNAAVKQLSDIRLVEERIGFQNLSESLAEIAALRMQYPEASLKELGQMLLPPVGKSGVNHRLRKLGMLADSLRENEEEQS